jgi:cbb3-type cytochrome oxidase subunit 3
MQGGADFLFLIFYFLFSISVFISAHGWEPKIANQKSQIENNKSGSCIPSKDHAPSSQ